VATLPLQLPEAVHEVAFVELQVSVEALPATTLDGDARSDTVGTVAALLPPPPQAASVTDTTIVRPTITARSKRECHCPLAICRRTGRISCVENFMNDSLLEMFLGSHGASLSILQCINDVVNRSQIEWRTSVAMRPAQIDNKSAKGRLRRQRPIRPRSLS